MKKTGLKRILGLLLALALVVPMAFAAENAAPQPETKTEAKAEETKTEETKTEETPNFFEKVKTTTLDGQEFDLSQYKGRLLMINIWADWCQPCRMEMPDLDRIAREYQDKVLLVGLLLEGGKVEGNRVVRDEHSIDLAKKVVEELKITYPNIVPDEILYTLMAKLNVQALPTTWFVNGEGQIIRVETGATDEKGWRTVIDGLLKDMEKEKDA